MSISSFIYRQKQKIKYHFANNDTKKIIAEINRNNEKILENSINYIFKELKLSIPKGKFDFIFENYTLFISNAKILDGKYEIIDGRLVFYWQSFKLVISSSSEIFIINEIFVEKCYNFYLPESDKDIIVLDIGMNVGIASLFFANNKNIKRVYSFEPFKPTYNKAVQNLSLNKIVAKKIAHYNYGLGNKYKILNVPYSSQNTGVNSTVNQTERSIGQESKQKIIIQDILSEIERIIKENKGKHIVLKIDTEGAEFEIFDRLRGKELNPEIRLIMLEWHFKNPSEIEEYLMHQGFAFINMVINRKAGLIYAFR
jgi:FkbM family methyltransferase